MDTNDSIALVTGASRGLGFAMARALGAAGVQVVALARTVGGLEDLDDAIREDGGPPPVLVPQDLTEDDAVDALGQTLAGRFERLDFWLHTAHWSPPVSPVALLDLRDLDKAWAVNVRPVAGLIRTLEPLLRKAPGPRAVFCSDPSLAAKMHHGAILASHAARDALVADWRRATARTAVTVTDAILPPMRTASRARLYPAETGALAEPQALAAALLAALKDDAGADRVDLTEAAP